MSTNAKAVAAESPTKFIIFTAGRTGSSWLMEMLNSHPAIGGYGELLTAAPATKYPQTRAALYSDPGGVPFFRAYLLEHGEAKRLFGMPFMGLKYLSSVYAPRNGLAAIGFRLIYGHLRQRWDAPVPVAGWLLPYVAAKRVRVLHLVRRNKLDLLLSAEVAAARGVRHARAGDDLAPSTIRINTQELESELDYALRKERIVRRLISGLRVPQLEVAYEDLVLDTSGVYRRIVEFLSVDPGEHEPHWRMRKVIETTREETVENYDDVVRALRGTKHGVFLEESRAASPQHA